MCAGTPADFKPSTIAAVTSGRVAIPRARQFNFRATTSLGLNRLRHASCSLPAPVRRTIAASSSLLISPPSAFPPTIFRRSERARITGLAG
ncbi:MAG TPA: hypothetical protein VMX35_01140 [Acidobacteriota bacterium]|nr:hypothetical protein [Acidobacteriota bacterium]